MPLLQFTPFSSVVSPAFWHKLTDIKIDVLKLSDDALPITGTYAFGRSTRDRETGREVVLPCSFSVGGESFDVSGVVGVGGDAGGESAAAAPGTSSITVQGSFKNFNTIEEFKSVDKTKLFNEEADKIYSSILTTRSTSSLLRFFLITFADLKKYKYYYWFAFPAFVAKPAWEIGEEGWSGVGSVFGWEELASINAQLRAQPSLPPFFLIRKREGQVEIGKVEDWDTLFEGVPPEERTLSFTDPSADPTHPGWPLRNILAYVRLLHPEAVEALRVVRWRDNEATPNENTVWKSQVGVVSLKVDEKEKTQDPASLDRPAAVGWERNPQGKLGARLADLGPIMDPTRLASQAVDLNLKLMRWRILPSLDLEKVSATRCLLLGAGTLGCYVARGLMAWGIRTITLLDSSRVSFSNPVRQPLFQFEDCLGGGKPKAECAAERLRDIYPGVNATGHTLSIPMPGHPIPPTPAALEQARKDVERLEELIDSHDAIFLLMDSRESRWLPTVIGASKGKIVINAALGFDTFLVMRHGVRASSVKEGAQRLGCYYCNDIVAPSDSLTDRTLDQMCTVTRPGLAPIASATAVELLASILQHPEGAHAPAPPPSAELAPTRSYADEGGSVLGVVPHQIRGFLAQFRNLQLVGAGYERCTGCSEVVLRAYEEQGFDMLLKAFNDQKYLEELSGLDKLAEEGEAALEAVDWNEDEGSGDDF